MALIIIYQLEQYYYNLSICRTIGSTIRGGHLPAKLDSLDKIVQLEQPPTRPLMN